MEPNDTGYNDDTVIYNDTALTLTSSERDEIASGLPGTVASLFPGETCSVTSPAVNHDRWRTTGRVVSIAPYCIAVSYRHPVDGDVTQWFDKDTGKLRGVSREDAVFISVG